MGGFTFFCCLVALLGCFGAEAVKIVDPVPDNSFAITGSEINFTCIVVGANGEPPVRVKFQRKKQMLWQDIPDTDRVYQTNRTEGDKVIATLHFKNITVGDDAELGRHSCVGFDSVGREERIGFTLRVTPKEDLPVFHVTPNRTASYGDKVKLYCRLTHNNNEKTTSIDRVTFFKNGIPVKQTNDVTQPLIIADVTARDGGNYNCIITVLLNRMQPYNVTPTTTAYLHIQVRFPFKESKIVADVGDSVALVCSAEGYPMNITWYKNKPGLTTVMKPGGRFIVQGRCRYCPSILVIKNVTAEDSGNYSCSARDNPGQQVFLVSVGANSTLSVAVPTTASCYMTTIFPAFIWILWPL